MLTAARAWVGHSHLRCRGVVGGCDHLSLHRRSDRALVTTRVGLEGPVKQPPPEVCKEGFEDEAGSWIRYSRKRKKLEMGAPVAEEAGGSGTRGTQAEEGKGDQIGAEMGSPSCLVCVDCGTSRTPLWRKGPAGPKSLCNACGIRYRKAKRSGGCPPNATAPAPASPGSDQRKGDPRVSPSISLSMKLTAAAVAAEQAKKQGEDRLRRKQRRRRDVLWLLLEESRKFELSCGREAVEAAVLLMAMSSGLFVRSC